MPRLTEQKAKDRAYRGWETRRRKNPNLRNIHQVGKNQYEWRRHNETVPLEDFTARQIENMSAGLAATDKHLKTSVELNAHIVGKRMSKRQGGFQYPAQQFGDTPRVVKGYMSFFHDIPKEDFGKRAYVKLNTRNLDKNSKSYTASGVAAHEIGHLVGPGRMTSKAKGGVGNQRIKEYAEAFQWRPPLKRPRKGLSEKNINTDISEAPWFWQTEGTHPASRSTNQGRWWEGGKSQKGLSKSKELWYGASNYHEDFAETYRNLVGVRLSDKEDKKEHLFHWEDNTSRSREKYMRQYHLRSTERK